MDVKVPCLCPPNAAGEVRHPDGDTVTLRERMDFRAATTARNAILLAKSEDADVSTAEVLAILTENYVLLGVQSWSIVDAKGKPVEVTKAAIREVILSRADAAMDLAEAANDLYSEAVMLPLVARALNSLPVTPTDESTSPTNGSEPVLLKRSRRSSTTTTPTDDTAAISPLRAGASS